jgi:flagellin-like hook-associated protein FlgL
MRANLVSLQQTNNMLEVTQKRLSTGKKVNSALDDPVAYFTAVAHDQRAGDLAARKDEMSEAVQLIKAADSGIESIKTLIAAAKSLATSALSAEASDVTTLKTQYDAVLTQITNMAADSGYKGVKLLDGTDDTLEIKFDEDGGSTLTLTGFAGSATGLSLATAAWSDDTAINTAITSLDTATNTLRTESSKLASNLSIITARQEFTGSMINVLKDGAANLTNADMNEEGANMLMLQTRQALGTTSLSLASQAAQSVLRLF